MSSKKRIRSPYCTNCGKVLQPSDNFCPNCGQENDNKRQSFGKVMSELVEGFLSIDSRLAQSLPALLFRPGFLTREYQKGRRQSYLDPVRMFITIVVLYFIIASFGESTILSENNGSFNNFIEQADQRNQDTTISINGVPLEIKVGDKSNSIIIPDSATMPSESVELDDLHYNQIKKMVKRGKTDTREVLDSLKIEASFWNLFYYGELIKFAQIDFDQFKNYLISKLPWIIFFLMPVFAVLLKLLYIRKDFLYIDHLIFAFHLHSFLFLAGVFDLTIKLITGIDIAEWLLLAVAVYILLAFKNFYLQSWKKTTAKIILLLFMYIVSAIICFVFSLIFIFLIY